MQRRGTRVGLPRSPGVPLPVRAVGAMTAREGVCRIDGSREGWQVFVVGWWVGGMVSGGCCFHRVYKVDAGELLSCVFFLITSLISISITSNIITQIIAAFLASKQPICRHLSSNTIPNHHHAVLQDPQCLLARRRCLGHYR